MPWDCSCGSVAVLDDEPACPACGSAKAAWTMHVDKTRTFRTSRKERVEVLCGTDERAVEASAGYAADVELVAATRAVSLPKATARRLAERGLLPAPAHVVVVRLHPRPGQDPALATTVLFETQEVAPQEHPREPLQAPGTLDAWFVLVHGPEAADDLAFAGLTVLDVTEPALEAGHAPQLGAAGLGAKRKDLPIEPSLAAHIHARLVRAPDGTEVEGPADLAWEKDGAPVTEADLPGAVLPATLPEDGVLRCEDLPWGSYTVQATLLVDGRELERVALPLQTWRDEAPHLQWVRLGPRRGHIHARLIHPLGFAIRGADLAWERDGEPVVPEDLGPRATLPVELGEDPTLRADGLPWGVWTVQATLRDPPPKASAPLERVALPLFVREDDEPHLQWLRWAERRARATPETTGYLHAKLFLEPTGELVTDAELSWETDGAPADGLPTGPDVHGVILAEGLAWGTYRVRATLPDGRTTAPVALPVLGVPGDPHPAWVRAEAPRGALHAKLVKAGGETIVDAALAWQKDGVDVTAVDGVALPARVGGDGVILVDGVPWGSYTVRPSSGSGEALAWAALPLLNDASGEPHVQWVRAAREG